MKLPENPWELTRLQPEAYAEWQEQARNGETLMGFKAWVENGVAEIPLTPYDTGERCEPKVWEERHRESNQDFGKVDFNADDDYTVATLWIERKEDGGYTLKGYNNEPLEVDLDDQSV